MWHDDDILIDLVLAKWIASLTVKVSHCLVLLAGDSLVISHLSPALTGI